MRPFLLSFQIACLIVSPIQELVGRLLVQGGSTPARAHQGLHI